MFNVTVLKIKDIVKYLVGTIILIGIIVYTTRFFTYKPNEQKIEKKQEKVSITETLKIRSNTLKKCLNKTIPVMAELEKEKKSKKTTNNENKIFTQQCFYIFLQFHCNSFQFQWRYQPRYFLTPRSQKPMS